MLYTRQISFSSSSNYFTVCKKSPISIRASIRALTPLNSTVEVRTVKRHRRSLVPTRKKLLCLGVDGDGDSSDVDGCIEGRLPSNR
ncbi:uncharacterized protein G2W53_004987 [Senna tora]|uniref:Uncharacterized protein n=1 Tax=Senna tora TaxID=362788 RepID=A0A834XE47_9FABA|nr:uncharacterized protein G2W53_004987 [Senna tora]